MSYALTKIVAFSIQKGLFYAPSQVGVYVGGDVLIKGNHKGMIYMHTV